MNKKFPVIGEIFKCPFCRREILVERGLGGVDHTIDTVVVCLKCLNPGLRHAVEKKYHKQSWERSLAKGDECSPQ